MPRYFENEVQQRRRELTAKETGIITDDMAARLRINSKNLFLETAGIDLGDDWEVPRTSIIPRMFVMGQDKDGHDRVMTFDAAGIKPGSKEFWAEAAKGNVFVFPAGQKEPSQLQYEPSNLETKISFSKPVPPAKMPDPPVRPLTFWQKVQNLFTGKYRRENTAWNSRAKDKDYTAQQLKNHIEIREDFLDTEKREAEKKLADHKEKQIQARLDSDYESALRDANAVDKCAKRMVNIFRPEPVVDNELLPKKAGAASFYSMDQFNDLTRYPKDGPDGFDLDSIEIGTSGHKATVEDFTAVTMFALWDDELAMKASKMKLQDPYAKQSLMENGFTEAEIDTTLASHTRNFYTCDLFIAKPRENLGDWHKPVTNFGRKAAVDAFKDYQKGDKGKLAAIIADGINKSAKNTAGLEGKVSAQDKAWIHNSGKLAELLEKDPELREMAEKKGMKPENLRTVTGIAKVGKMIVEADKANAEIAKARAQHRDLTADEKMKYAKTVVKAKLAQARIASENSAPNPGLDEKKMKLMMKGQKLPAELERLDADRSRRPAPSISKLDGKMDIYVDTKSSMLGMINTTIRDIPEYPGKLADQAAEQTLEQQAEYICKKHGMENKSMDELFKDLYENKLNVAKDVLEAEKAVNGANAQKQGPEVQKQGPDAQKDAVREQPEAGGHEKEAGPVPTA